MAEPGPVQPGVTAGWARRRAHPEQNSQCTWTDTERVKASCEFGCAPIAAGDTVSRACLQVACTTDAECGTELTCDTGLGYFGVPSAQERGLTLACMEGSANCVSDTLLDEAGQPVPGSGFCVDRTGSAAADTPAGRVSSLAFRQRIGLRDEAEPWRYHTVEVWLTTKFINTTTRTVTRFDPASAAANRAKDYPG